MQAAGYLVAVLVELAAGVQHRQDDLGCRTLGLVLVVELDADRNAAPVVCYGNRVVAMNDDLDVVAMTGQRFVDGVVHHLEHHMVQTGSIGRVADVHTGTLTYCLQPFELLDA